MLHCIKDSGRVQKIFTVHDLQGPKSCCHTFVFITCVILEVGIKVSASSLSDSALSLSSLSVCTSSDSMSPFLCGELVFAVLKLQQHAVQSARCIKAH